MAQIIDPLLSDAKNIPKDALVMVSILKEMGIVEYEERIVNHMLEIANRYVSDIIDDAQRYANHANKKTIDSKDIELAIDFQSNNNFVTPPEKEVTASMAKHKNSMPLPQIKSSAGLRLPADRYSLTACNYRVKPAAKRARTVQTVSRWNITNVTSNSINKGPGAVTSLNKSSPITTNITKANSTPIITKPPNNNNP